MKVIPKIKKDLILEKVSNLSELSVRCDKLFEEIMLDWLEIETGKNFENFENFLKDYNLLEYYKSDFREYKNFTLIRPKKLPENLSKDFTDFLEQYFSKCEIMPLPVCGYEYYESFSFSGVTDLLEDKMSSFLDSISFDYYSKEFRELRLEVFLRDGEVCAKCGAIPGPNISLTVDHIKPVSKFPELSMDKNNLQVLCWTCNQNKSNYHCTDYRNKVVKKNVKN